MTGDYHAKVDTGGRLRVPRSPATAVAEVDVVLATKPTTELVQVPCPQCGNTNRAARRQCRRGGPCGGSGMVTKTVPTAEAQARAITDTAFDQAAEERATELAEALAEAFPMTTDEAKAAVHRAMRMERTDDDDQGIADAAAAVGKALGYPASYVEPAIRQAIRAEQGDDG